MLWHCNFLKPKYCSQNKISRIHNKYERQDFFRKIINHSQFTITQTHTYSEISIRISISMFVSLVLVCRCVGPGAEAVMLTGQPDERRARRPCRCLWHSHTDSHRNSLEQDLNHPPTWNCIPRWLGKWWKITDFFTGR